MKKNKFQKLNKLNNKGVTLVEIIVAMAILAVVVVPFVHSFVTAANTNRKSRETLNGTTIAEDIMELFEDANVQNETANIKSIIDAKIAAGLDVADAGSVSSDANGVYTIEMGSDVLAEYIGESFVNDGYSAKIVLDPCNNVTQEDGTVLSGKYNDVNVVNGNLANMVKIDSKSCGIYAMDIDFDDEQIADLKDKVGASFDEDLVKRSIKIELNDNGAHLVSGVRFVKVKVTIEYKYDTTYSITPVQSFIYDNTVETSQVAYPFRSIYLIFTPLYSDKSATKTFDTIEINNVQNIPCEIYLLHESNKADFVSADTFQFYKVPISVIENKSGSVDENFVTSTFIRTNLHKQVVKSTDPEDYFKYLIGYDDVNYSLNYYKNPSSTAVTDKKICNTILDVRGADGRYIFTESVKNTNRIYNMTVTISKNGRKVIDISGTKLNKAE